jgi:hypothetical protein
VRLFLDAHLSGRVIGRHFRELGHDTFALDEHRELDGLDDPDVLALAAKERRVLITHNVRDFPDVLREWAEEGRTHAGCVILVGVRLDQFGLLVRCIEAAFERVPKQHDWLNRVMQVGRQDLGQA